MNKRILITGASGLIGTRLKTLLQKRGYEVSTVGRGKTSTAKKHFQWDVENMQMDVKAIENVSAIIHLAGAGVAEQRWTKSRKKEILNSRVNSTRLLFKTLSENKHHVGSIISASAVGFYGDCGDELLSEEHPPAKTFLADVCIEWEREVQKFQSLNIREVRCRIGIVLSKHGGALPELSKSMQFGVAGYFTKSPLFYPWIHIDDVCGIFIHALENKQMNGAFNTVAPQPLELKDLMKSIIKGLNKRAVLIPAPPFALKLAMGEMADMLLSSQRCSAKKIIESGYKFQYSDAEKAVRHEI